MSRIKIRRLRTLGDKPSCSRHINAHCIRCMQRQGVGLSRPANFWSQCATKSMQGDLAYRTVGRLKGQKAMMPKKNQVSHESLLPLKSASASVCLVSCLRKTAGLIAWRNPYLPKVSNPLTFELTSEAMKYNDIAEKDTSFHYSTKLASDIHHVSLSLTT